MDIPASETLPAHTGLLRDEVLVLRKLFGYGRTSSFNLELDLGNPLPSLPMRDVLLVAFDVDTKHSYDMLAQHDLECHIGIAILDTRAIHDCIQAPASRRAAAAAAAIQSHQFRVGDLQSKYLRRAAKKFLFGETESISLADLPSVFQKLTADRQTVLVFHGGSASDWPIFQSLGLGRQPLYVLDTVKAAQHPLRLSYRLSLEKLLDVFGIAHEGLHAAGNDAHFCLRALLMIAVTDAETEEMMDKEISQALTDIARQPLPTKPDEPDAAEVALQARRQETQEAKVRHKAKRAEKIERRKQEREARSQSDIQ